MSATQLNLLEPSEADRPESFDYRKELLAAAEETALIDAFSTLPFREFEFHGYFGKRRTVSFGLHYDFAGQRMRQAEPMPEFLMPLRERAAAFASIPPYTLEHALVTEYTAGAAIGWHRDRPVFGDVIGVSLASSCRFRFRRKCGERWDRLSLNLMPRSAYLLRGSARTEWEHSIPPAEQLRYSVTFRTVRSS